MPIKFIVQNRELGLEILGLLLTICLLVLTIVIASQKDLHQMIKVQNDLFYNNHLNMFVIQGSIMGIYWIRAILSLKMFKDLNSLVTIFGLLVWDLLTYFIILLAALLIFCGAFTLVFRENENYDTFWKTFLKLVINPGEQEETGVSFKANNLQVFDREAGKR